MYNPAEQYNHNPGQYTSYKDCNTSQTWRVQGHEQVQKEKPHNRGRGSSETDPQPVKRHSVKHSERVYSPII